jgi:hypothetical protein
MFSSKVVLYKIYGIKIINAETPKYQIISNKIFGNISSGKLPLTIDKTISETTGTAQ